MLQLHGLVALALWRRRLAQMRHQLEHQLPVRVPPHPHDGEGAVDVEQVRQRLDVEAHRADQLRLGRVVERVVLALVAQALQRIVVVLKFLIMGRAEWRAEGRAGGGRVSRHCQSSPPIAATRGERGRRPRPPRAHLVHLLHAVQPVHELVVLPHGGGHRRVRVLHAHVQQRLRHGALPGGAAMRSVGARRRPHGGPAQAGAHQVVLVHHGALVVGH